MRDPLAHLPPGDRDRAESLAEAFRRLGAEEPEAWAASEVEENIPQLARFIFLRRLWRGAEPWTLSPAAWFVDPGAGAAEDDGDEEDADDSAKTGSDEETEVEPAFLAAQQAVERILAAGVDPADLQEVARAVFLHSAFDAVLALDEGHDPDAGEGMPGWLLAEVSGDLMTTNRVLDGLHEDLLTTEP